ncbi:MAG: Ig-like domain-containing protein, partial [Clostridia bacterium]|nr:Ig-like domain-containing protein [Clostridia bacterium]
LSESNVLTAKKPGKATITVTAPVNSKTTRTDSVEITVLPMPQSITPAEGKVVLGVSEPGRKVQGEYPEGTMCEFTYKSLNEEIATVNPTTGAITALKEGEAKVEITSANSVACKTECTVQVVPAPDKIAIGVGTLQMGKGNKFDLLKSGLIKNDPAGSSASYSFKSSDSRYVSVDSNGILTAKANGTITITVTSHNDQKATMKVKVYTLPKSVSLASEEITLGVGMKGSFKVVYPSGTYALYEVTSADESTVTVDDNNTIFAVKEGEASVVVTTSNKLTTVGKVKVVPAPATVAFEKDHYTVAAEGMSLQTVPVINDGAMASYTFSSSDTSIVTIDENGVITGLKGGEATITVETQNGCSATAKVTVTPAPAELVYEDLTTIVIAKGDTIELPEPLALDASSNECPSTFTYKSSNAKVAKVSGSKVTGVAAGTVTITVSSYNKKSTTFKLTVSSKAITGVDLVVKEKTLYINDLGYTESVHIGASVVGSGLNEGSMTYTSSNPDVAEVTADGLVTAKRPGTATITAAAFNGKSAKATITVAKLSSTLGFAKTEERMTEQKTLQLTPIFDAGTSAPVSYQSSDASIASVDENGLITALKPGDVTINAIVDVEGEETRFDLSASVKLHIIAAPKNIFLNVTGVNLMAGESITLEPKLEADAEEFDKTIVFKSTDEWTAKVDPVSGIVTALAAGEAVITAETCNGLTASCKVFVVAEGETPAAGFDWEDEVTIVAGDSANLEINLNKAAFERGFVIASSDPEKLSVDMEKLTIQALAAGTVDLTMTINPAEGEESGESYKCAVTVINGTQISFSAEKLELRALSATAFDESSAELKINNPHKNLIGTYRLTVEDESLVIYDADAGIVQALEFAGDTRIVLNTYNQEIVCSITVINRPVYRALIIGEFNNSGASNDLPFVGNNTNAMQKVLEASVIDGEKYAKVVKKASNPTKSQIQSAISETFGDAREGDVSVLYIVSHGYDVAANGGYHFGIYNYSKSNPATYVRHSDLMDWLAPIKGNVVLVLDSCKSGAFIRDAKSRLESEGNIAVITAQSATKNASFYQGTTVGTQVEFLTYTFCEGLGYVYSDKSTGKPKWLGSIPADGSPTDRAVTVKEIFSYTDKNVPTLVAQYMKTFTNGRSKFRVPGVYTTSALKSWGGQDPQVFMPNSMENVVIFGY